MIKKPVTTKAPAEQVVKDIRRATRKLHSSEEKIRIVLSGPAPVSFRSFESDTRHQGDRIWQQYTSFEFKRDAVRIAQTSGLSKRQVASDLGVGLSTLNKWVKMVSDEAGPPDPDQTLLRENERLRRENRILKEERELLKKATQFFAAQKP